MSPEQARGQSVDGRSDVFSLGAVMYEMVTGCRPFDGANVVDTIDAVLHQDPRAVSELRSEAPPALDALIAKCLVKDQDKRCQSVEQLWTDLLEVRQGTTPRISIQPPSRRHNLPLHATSFIGRESEVAELCSVLAETRLLTLSGSGGCGKTRLALRVASKVLDNYPDGVWLIELGPVTHGEFIPQSVASTLGVEEEPGRPLQQRVADYLGAKRLLLVLDNCEHLVAAAAAFVQSMLASCEGLHIVTTSRDPLRIPGERIWRVSPLSVPESASLSLAEASNYESVQLFVERARAVSPLILDHASANHVVEICRRLDGIPLAVEMAAARLDVVSLDQIASRLNDRFGLLTRTHRTSSPRQETLRSTIDWSYDLLSFAEQTLFRRLAVFAGTFSLEAVEHVCSGSDLRSRDVLGTLSGLIEKSLVTVSRTNMTVRYRLLETILEYARERFVGSSDERRTRRHHLEFFLALVERLEPEFYSGRTAHYHDQIELEHQNALAALDWCSKRRGRSRAALRLASALRPFWSARCYHQLGTQILLRELHRDRRQAPKPILTKALDAAGYFLRVTGELEPARSAHEESLRLAEESGDRPAVAKALWELGITASMQGKEVEAEALQQQSLAMSRKHGARLTTASALDNLGIHAFHRGEYGLAHSYWQESHDIFRALGFEVGLTMSLLHLAAVASQTDQNRAMSLATEAVAKARQTRHSGNVAFALMVLGSLTAKKGDYHGSRVLYEEALAIVRAVGHKRHMARVLVSLGDISMSEARYAEADCQLTESYALLTHLHDERSSEASQCLQSLGWLALERGHLEHARELCERAASCEDFKTDRQNLQRLSGWVCLAQRDHAGARVSFAQSLKLAGEMESIGGMAGAQLGLGYTELLEDRVPEAQSLFHMALSVFERFDNRGRMTDAYFGLGDASFREGQFEQARAQYLRGLRLACGMGRRRDVARALQSVGVIAARRQQPHLATRCFAASNGLLEAVGCTLAPFESYGYEEALESARSELGLDPFQLLWDESRIVPIERIDELIHDT
jgi:non-specific serine/threonine protein kinase